MIHIQKLVVVNLSPTPRKGPVTPRCLGVGEDVLCTFMCGFVCTGMQPLEEGPNLECSLRWKKANHS